MSTRRTLWCVLATSLAATAGAVVFLAGRLREHAFTVAKVAVTSGAIVTAAAPFTVADKGRLLTMFVDGELEQAKSLFEGWSEEASITLLPEVFSEWLRGATHKTVSQEIRTEALDYITTKHPSNWYANDESIWSDVTVAHVLWHYDQPHKALEYSMNILACVSDTPAKDQQEGFNALNWLLDKLKGFQQCSERQLEARRTFAKACVGALSARKIGSEGQPIRLARAVATEFIFAGATDAGFDYMDQVLDTLATEGKSNVVRYETLAFVQELVRWSPNRVGVGVAARAIGLAAKYISNEELTKLWDRLIGNIPSGKQRQKYCARLVARYGIDAIPRCLIAMSDNAKSITIEEIIIEHCELIAFEIEAGNESSSLSHLINELQGRNARAYIERVTEFFWRNYPTEPIGPQAFDAWSISQTGVAGEAVTARVCREVMGSYSTEPIGDRARLALARSYANRGMVVEGLLMMIDDEEGDSIDDEAVLSSYQLRELIGRLVGVTSDKGRPVDRHEMFMGLARQLDLAGENALAVEFYWRAFLLGNVDFADPRTGLPIDLPDDYEQVGAREAACQVEFWRILALAAGGSMGNAIRSMEELIEEYPKIHYAGLAHLFLAKHLTGQDVKDKAIEHINAVPQEINYEANVALLYEKLVGNLPAKLKTEQERHKAEQQQRIEALRSSFLANPDAATADATLMNIADLLLMQRDYAGAAVNYEAVAREYPASSYCPKALFRAITLYQSKTGNTARAEQLVRTLRAQYPQSRYAAVFQ